MPNFPDRPSQPATPSPAVCPLCQMPQEHPGFVDAQQGRSFCTHPFHLGTQVQEKAA